MKEYKKEYKEAKQNAKSNYKIIKDEAKREFKEQKQELKGEKKFKKIKYKQQKMKLKKSKPKKIRNSGPKLSVLEEIGNSITHGVGAIFSVVALILMLGKADTDTEVLSSIVYFGGLFSMFLISTLYHAFRYGSMVKIVFRRLDYSSIYILIGATYTPLLLLYLGGTLGSVLAGIEWVVIVIGITMMAVFGANRLKWLHFPLYFVIGWSGLLFIPMMIANNLQLFGFILAGGVMYTLGMIPFVRKQKSSHFVWHFFVLAGAVLHWVGIYLYLL